MEHWGKGFIFQEQVIKYAEIFGQGSGSFMLLFRPRQGKVDNRLLPGKTVKVSDKGWREGNR